MDQDRIGFLHNEQAHLKTRILRLKTKGAENPELTAWHLKTAQDNYKKNQIELKRLQAKGE